MSTASVGLETERSQTRDIPPVAAVAVVCLLEFLLFRQRLLAMTLQSETIQWFVFVVAVLLLLVRTRNANFADRLPWKGLCLVSISIGALLLLDATRRPYVPTTPLLLALCTLGSVWTLFGQAEAKRELFPSAYLLLMTPIPTLVTVSIDLPLQNLSAALASDAARLLGIATERAGTTIALAHSELSLRIIGDCNGLRSATAMFAISVLLAWLLRASLPKACVIVVSAIAIAYAANIARLTSILALVSHFGERFVAHLHVYELWVDGLLFLASVLLVIQLTKALGCRTFREI